MLPSKEILFISHHNDTELGLMEEFFLSNSYNIHITKPLHGNILPTNIDNYAGVIILGGAMNVDDKEKYPELEKELKWIENLINTNIPIIGICLGAQLIAKVCGAKVQNHKKNLVEIGYKNISFINSSTIVKSFPPKVYHWHKQGFSLPNNAIHLASNSIFDIQAFSIKDKIIGFQFHPEVVEDMILNWNIKTPQMLSMNGAVNTDIQLKDHSKYSEFVKRWFNNLLKNWLDLN